MRLEKQERAREKYLRNWTMELVSRQWVKYKNEIAATDVQVD